MIIIAPFLTFNGKNLRVGNRIASEMLVYLLLILFLFYELRVYINTTTETIILLSILIYIILLSFKSRRKTLIVNLIQYRQYINMYMVWIFIVLFFVNFSNIINFGADSNNHLQRIARFETMAESYDGYPIAWHQIFKFESDLATYLLFDKIVFWVGIYIITAILIGLSVKTKIQVMILILFPFSYILKWTFTAWPTQLWILFIFLFLVFGENVIKNSIKLKEICILTLINFALIISNPSLIILLNSSLLLVILLNSYNKRNINLINIIKIIISILLASTLMTFNILQGLNFKLTKVDTLYSVPVSGGVDYGDGSTYTNGLLETLSNYFIFKKTLNFFIHDTFFYLIFLTLIILTILWLIKSKSFNKIVLIFLLTSLSSVMTGIGEPAVIRGRSLFVVLILLWIFALNYDYKINKIVNQRSTFFAILLFASILFIIQNVYYLNLVTIWNTRSMSFDRIYNNLYALNVYDSYHKESNFFSRLVLFENVCDEKNLSAEVCLNKNKLELKKVWTTDLFRDSS